MKNQIAYIDDSKNNLECIDLVLSQEFAVETYQMPDLFLDAYAGSSFAAILVDIHMPKIDGFALYEKIIHHEHYNGCPILFISSDDTDSARIKSFNIGAVDFINRHMSPDEVLARVKSKIEFFNEHKSIMEFSNLKVNITLLKAFIDDEEIPITFMEFKVLCFALKHYPEPITKKQLVEEIWTTGHVLHATIHTHISNLNFKLEKWNYSFLSIRHKGIFLVEKSGPNEI